MNFDSSVPGSIGKRNFALVWFVTRINGTPVEDTYITDTGFHVYYTLLSTPQNPMPEPWTEVLDYACVWAFGKTSESSALEKITYWAYVEFGKDHDYYGGDTHAPGTTFHLTSFFAADWADCRDMSAVVHVFTRAIGGTQTKVRMIDDPDPYVENFKYKSIDPVGTPSWQTGWWNFHQVANYSGVYDATLKLANPVRIPTGENINGDYKEDLFDPVTGSVWVPKSLLVTRQWINFYI